MKYKPSVWDILLVVCIAAVALPQMLLGRTYLQVPGPMYGGDLYSHYGHALHIADGGSVFMSSHYAGEYEAYPWLSHAFVAFLSVIFNVTLLRASFVLVPFFVIAGGAILMYVLGSRVFGQRAFGLALAALWMTWLIPTPSPTTVAVIFMVPALVLSMSKIETWKHSVIAGVVLGLAALQHLTAFLGGVMLVVLFGFFHILRQLLHFKNGTLRIKKKWKKPVLGVLKTHGIVLVIGVIISLVYFSPVIFNYHFQTPNPWQTYTAGGVENVSVWSGLRMVRDILIDFSGPLTVLLSFVALFGLYAAWKLRMLGLPLTLILVGLVGFLHPIITMPLLDTSFGHYRFNIFVYPAKFILICASVYFGWSFVAKLVKKPVHIWITAIAVICVVAVSALQFSSALTLHKNDQWTKVGQSVPESTRALLDLGEQLRTRTDVNDVFLSSHGESAFALNAFSGRKIVFMRRTHASPYVDVNERIADSAVIMYGNDDAKRSELVDKYGIKYFYDDFYSLQSRNQCRSAWDSLQQNPEAAYACLTVTPEWRSYLESYNVTVQTVRARFDPSLTDAPTFEQLAILPLEQPRLNLQPAYAAQTPQGTVAIVFTVG